MMWKPVAVCSSLALAGASQAQGQLPDSSDPPMVVSSPASALETELAWRIELDGALAIDPNDPNGVFGFVSGGLLLPSSGFVVLDGQSNELSWFGSDGTFLRRTGGSGGGPGEFRRPSLVPSLYGDTVPVTDMSGRISLYSLSGAFERSVEVRSILGSPHGIFRALAVLTRSTTSVGPSSAEEWKANAFNLDVIDIQTGSRSTLMSLEGPPLLFVVAGGPAAMMEPSRRPRVRLAQAPFSVEPPVAASSSGIWVASAAGYELVGYDENGDVARRITVDALPPVITSQMREDALADFLADEEDAGMRGRMTAFIGDAPMPERLPGFDALAAGASGQLWGRLYSSDAESIRRWLVVDHEAGALGYVSLPGSFDVLSVADGFVLLRRTDPFGVHSIVRARLRSVSGGD